MEKLDDILTCFSPISLAEMDNIKLMSRVDTKFVLNAEKLPGILSQATNDYRVLEISSKRIMAYESLYFDTPDHRMYLNHHNRKLNRYKFRIRQYMDSQEFFAEVKFKTNKGNTRKTRIRVAGYDSLREEEVNEFLALKTPYTADQIQPALFTTFDRMTLANPEGKERITIDFNLNVHNTKKSATIPYLVIIEVKRESVTTSEGFSKILRDERIKAKRISKYCTGTNLLYPEVKRNRFKAKLLYINKLDKTQQHDRLYSSAI